MAIYTIDHAVSDNAFIQSVRDVLAAAGIITTVHYHVTSTLIVTTTRSNKVIKILGGTRRLQISVGDAYSSGTTITNEVTIMTPGSSSTAEAIAIVTDTVLTLCHRDTSALSVLYNTVFGRLNNLSEDYFAMGWICNALTTSSVIRNTSLNASMSVHTLQPPVLVSTGGNYYASNLICSSGGSILTSSIQGIKGLQRDWVRTSLNISYGDDASLSGGATAGLLSYFPGSFLIEDGVSWTPPS